MANLLEPTLQVKTRSNNANRAGDIFGGWLMSQIDIAGATTTAQSSKGSVVTVAVKELKFLQTLFRILLASILRLSPLEKLR